MTLKIITIFISLIFFIAQPASISKADEDCDKWFQEEIDNLPNALRAFRVGQGHLDVENFEHAMILFEIAAEQGHATAQYNLGLRYDQGQEVTQNLSLRHI